jgi:hypothetical protein
MQSSAVLFVGFDPAMVNTGERGLARTQPYSTCPVILSFVYNAGDVSIEGLRKKHGPGSGSFPGPGHHVCGRRVGDLKLHGQGLLPLPVVRHQDHEGDPHHADTEDNGDNIEEMHMPHLLLLSIIDQAGIPSTNRFIQ